MGRNIVIEPNRSNTGSTQQPHIYFSGLTAGTISLVVEDDGSLVYDGTYGALFSITDTKNGLLNSVNDISGLSILQVWDDNRVILGSYYDPALTVSGSTTFIGPTGSTTSKLHISGGTIQYKDGNQSSGKVLTSDSNGVANWQNLPVTTGILGISNSAGTYTFYSTLVAAMSAATSGQVIEMFADITETGSVSVTLKDGVNINGNGHTYTLNNTGTTSCFIDNGVSVTSIISNITIKRIGASVGSLTTTACLLITGASKIGGSIILSSTNSIALYVNNTSAKIQNINVYTSSYGCCNVALGTLSDSYINCASPNADSALTIGGFVMNTNVECSSQAYGINISSTGYAENCSINTVSGIGIYCYGKAFNCTAFASSAIAIRGNYNTGIIQNCVGYSSASYGIYTDTSVIINSSGYSTAQPGINAYASSVYNSFGYSTASNGISIVNGNDGACYAYNCTAISTAAIGMSCIFQGGEIKNCTAISRWNNAGGHAMQVSSGINASNGSVTGCNLQVTNASSNCLYASSSVTLKYANMVFANSTTAVNANITQGITNTSDNQGNILI